MALNTFASIRFAICIIFAVIFLAGDLADAAIRIPCCPPCRPPNCLGFLIRGPGGPPVYSFFLDRGIDGNAPCCGPTCSMVRCLEFNRLVLNSLEEPLEIEKKGKNGDYDDGDDNSDCTDKEQAELGVEESDEALLKQLGMEKCGLKPVFPKDGCCGRGCKEGACFSYLLSSLVKIQFPIQETIDHFNKSGTEKPKLESFLGGLFGSDDGDDGKATKETERKEEL